MLDESRVNEAKLWCCLRHLETNHQYEPGVAYSYHLQMVASQARVHGPRVLTDPEFELALCGAWAHDVIEDARQSYNDVRKALGEDVAEVAYKLTNNRGRSRAERQGGDYYPLIASCPVATFVKCCDRLANVTHAKSRGSSMYEKYKAENQHFIETLALHADTADIILVLGYMDRVLADVFA